MTSAQYILGLFILLGAAIYMLRKPSRNTLLLRSPLVIDGDTIFANGVKYRIHGIDAPEMGQQGGQTAKQYLTKLLMGAMVTIEIMDTDRYGRPVARLFVKSMDIGGKMVEQGFARAYFHPDYRQAEREARRDRRGLWSLRDGMPDAAAFRKNKRGRAR